MACLDVFFRIIPQSAAVGNQVCQHEARCDIAGQETTDRRNAADETNSECDQDGQKTCRNQFFDRANGGNVDAAVVVRQDTRFAFAQTRYFIKLAMNLGHHALGIATTPIISMAEKTAGTAIPVIRQKIRSDRESEAQDFASFTTDDLLECGQQSNDGQSAATMAKPLVMALPYCQPNRADR
jgi:hypothetical protein